MAAELCGASRKSRVVTDDQQVMDRVGSPCRDFGDGVRFGEVEARFEVQALGRQFEACDDFFGRLFGAPGGAREHELRLQVQGVQARATRVRFGMAARVKFAREVAGVGFGFGVTVTQQSQAPDHGARTTMRSSMRRTSKMRMGS